MCLDDDDNSAAQCACATEARAAEVGAEDAAFYDAVGTRYLANRKDGLGTAEAWDAAIADTAAEAGLGRIALLIRMNAVGSAHRAATNACRWRVTVSEYKTPFTVAATAGFFLGIPPIVAAAWS